MKTYRMYALDITNALEPTVHIVYVQAAKYDLVWKGARAALDTDRQKEALPLFATPECKDRAALRPSDNITCVRIDELKARNVKLDKAALQAVLDDEEASPEEKLEAMKALLA